MSLLLFWGVACVVAIIIMLLIDLLSKGKKK